MKKGVVLFLFVFALLLSVAVSAGSTIRVPPLEDGNSGSFDADAPEASVDEGQRLDKLRHETLFSLAYLPDKQLKKILEKLQLVVEYKKFQKTGDFEFVDSFLNRLYFYKDLRDQLKQKTKLAQEKAILFKSKKDKFSRDYFNAQESQYSFCNGGYHYERIGYSCSNVFGNACIASEPEKNICCKPCDDINELYKNSFDPNAAYVSCERSPKAFNVADEFYKYSEKTPAFTWVCKTTAEAEKAYGKILTDAQGIEASSFETPRVGLPSATPTPSPIVIKPKPRPAPKPAVTKPKPVKPIKAEVISDRTPVIPEISEDDKKLNQELIEESIKFWLNRKNPLAFDPCLKYNIKTCGIDDERCSWQVFADVGKGTGITGTCVSIG